MAPPTKSRQCLQCNRVFTKHEHLLRHLRTHTGEKPFKCDVCSRSFSRKDVLVRHAKGHSKRSGAAAIDDDDDAANDEMDEDAPVASGSGANHFPEPLPPPIPPTPVASTSYSAIPMPAVASTSYSNLDSMPAFVPPQSPPAPQPFLATSAFALDAIDFDAGVLFGADMLVNMPTMLSEQASWSAPASPPLGPVADLHDWTALLADVTAPTPAVSDAGSQGIERDRETLDAIGQLWPKVRHARQSEPAARTGGSKRFAGLSGALHALDARIEFSAVDAPSGSFLSAAVSSFFRVYSLETPLFVPAAFEIQSRPPILQLAICATGARFMPLAEARTFAEQTFARLDLLLARYWSEPDHAHDIDLLAVAVMTQDFKWTSGLERLLASAVSLQGTLVARARAAGLFSARGPCQIPNLTVEGLATASDEALTAMWREWVAAQEARWLVAAILASESNTHALCRTAPPHLSLSTSHILLPSDNQPAFSAASARTWSAVIVPGRQELSALEILRRLWTPLTLGVEGYGDGLRDAYALRTVLNAAYQHERSRRLAVFPDSDGRPPFDVTSVEANLRWYTDLFLPCPVGHGPMARWLHREIDITFHAHMLGLLVNLDLLERAIGREGADEASEAAQVLTVDAQAHPARHRRMLLHAAQVVAALDEAKSAPNLGLAVITIGFKCALILSFFPPLAPRTVFVDTPYSLESAIDWNELGLAGVGAPVPFFPDDLAMSAARRFVHLGGPATFMHFGRLEEVDTRRAILNWSADVLTSLASISRPIAIAFANVLRVRANALSL